MQKLKAFLDRWRMNAEAGRRKPKYPPVTFDVLWEICRDLSRNGYAEFIQADAKEVCEKCGLTVEPCGVGWMATLDKRGINHGRTDARRRAL